MQMRKTGNPKCDCKISGRKKSKHIKIYIVSHFLKLQEESHFWKYYSVMSKEPKILSLPTSKTWHTPLRCGTQMTRFLDYLVFSFTEQIFTKQLLRARLWVPTMLGARGQCSEEAWQGPCPSAMVLSGGSMALERCVRKSGAEEVFWAVCFITHFQGSHSYVSTRGVKKHSL